MGYQPWTARLAPLWMTQQDTFEMATFVKAKMENDDEITSAELHRLISRHFSSNFLPPTIRRYIQQKLEWVAD